MMVDLKVLVPERTRRTVKAQAAFLSLRSEKDISMGEFLILLVDQFADKVTLPTDENENGGEDAA